MFSENLYIFSSLYGLSEVKDYDIVAKIVTDGVGNAAQYRNFNKGASYYDNDNC